GRRLLGLDCHWGVGRRNGVKGAGSPPAPTCRGCAVTPSEENVNLANRSRLLKLHWFQKGDQLTRCSNSHAIPQGARSKTKLAGKEFIRTNAETPPRSS